jgi:hypothetical protein
MPGSLIRINDIASATPVDLPPGNPDLEEAALNVNVVLRWEYKIGSTFFLVYSRSQIPAVGTLGDAPATLDYHALGRRASADVILLKLSYWWAS